MTKADPTIPATAERDATFKNLMIKFPGRTGCTSKNWTSRVFFRPWTVYLSRLLVTLGFSANAVTLLSGISLVMGAMLLAFNRTAAMLGGAALVVFSHALDHCDGEVARFRRLTRTTKGGRDGEYWDGIVHGLEPILVGCLAFRLYQDSGLGPWPLIVAVVDVAAMCVAPWQRYCEIIVMWLHRQPHLENETRLQMLAYEPHNEHVASAGQDIVPPNGLCVWIKQLLLFPGYYVTLPAAVILDVVAGPIALRGVIPEHIATEPHLYWVGLWLLMHAAGKTLWAVSSSYRFARRLRDLAD